MDRGQVAEFERVGSERVRELERMMTSSDPGSYLKEFGKLSWIEIQESIFAPAEISRIKEAFGLTFLTFLSIIQSLLAERGPGIFGYMNKLVLSFNPLADARYFTRERDVHFNVGFLLLFHELSGLFAWIESVLLNRNTKTISVRELELLCPPADVRAEMRRFSEAYKGLLVSGRVSQSPIYEAVIRFILCHELAHLIYFAESDHLKAQWRDVAWSDYEDALQHYIEVYKLDRGTANRLSRNALGSDVAANWELEFIADGLGFYLASRVQRPSPAEPRLNQQILQIALEVFFHALVVVYHGDRGSRTHPPPLLRAMMIAARGRQDYKISWADFKVKVWGSGTITSVLFEKLTYDMKETHDVKL